MEKRRKLKIYYFQTHNCTQYSSFQIKCNTDNMYESSKKQLKRPTIHSNTYSRELLFLFSEKSLSSFWRLKSNTKIWLLCSLLFKTILIQWFPFYFYQWKRIKSFLICVQIWYEWSSLRWLQEESLSKLHYQLLIRSDELSLNLSMRN